MSAKTGIGYSPLTDTVYIGRQNQQKRMWVGEKRDITNDFIQVMMAYVPENSFRHISGSRNHEFIFFHLKNDVDGIEKGIKNLTDRLNKMNKKKKAAPKKSAVKKDKKK